MDVTEDDLYVPRPAIRDLSLRRRHQGQTIMDRQHASSLEVELSACEQLCLVMMAAFHRHRDFFFSPESDSANTNDPGNSEHFPRTGNFGQSKHWNFRTFSGKKYFHAGEKYARYKGAASI